MAEPMSIEEAFTVAEQLSPMPAVAHRALQALLPHARRWLFWRDLITEESGRLRALLETLRFPRDQPSWDARLDEAIVMSGWKTGAFDPTPVVEDPWHTMDTAPQDTAGVAVVARMLCCVKGDNRVVMTAGRQNGVWIYPAEHEWEFLFWTELPPLLGKARV